jgi:hypothetical protein
MQTGVNDCRSNVVNLSPLSEDEAPLRGVNAMPARQRTRTPLRLWALALAIAAIYWLDLRLPRTLPLLSFYWIPVVLAASFATPRQVALLAIQSLSLGVISGLQLGMFAHPDYSLHLIALTAISGLTLRLSQERQHLEPRCCEQPAGRHTEGSAGPAV